MRRPERGIFVRRELQKVDETSPRKMDIVGSKAGSIEPSKPFHPDVELQILVFSILDSSITQTQYFPAMSSFFPFWVAMCILCHDTIKGCNLVLDFSGSLRQEIALCLLGSGIKTLGSQLVACLGRLNWCSIAEGGSLWSKALRLYSFTLLPICCVFFRFATEGFSSYFSPLASPHVRLAMLPCGGGFLFLWN